MYNKYRVANKSDRTIDNIIFDSKAEMTRYIHLKHLQKKGLIKELETQPLFILQDKFRIGKDAIRQITYKADFKYIENDRIVIEDVKGLLTPEYKLKKRIFIKMFVIGEGLIFREFTNKGIKDYKL